MKNNTQITMFTRWIILTAFILCSFINLSRSAEPIYPLFEYNTTDGGNQSCYENVLPNKIINVDAFQDKGNDGAVLDALKVDNITLCKKNCCSNEQCNALVYVNNNTLEENCFLIYCESFCTYSSTTDNVTVVGMHATVDGVAEFLDESVIDNLGSPSLHTEKPIEKNTNAPNAPPTTTQDASVLAELGDDLFEDQAENSTESETPENTNLDSGATLPHEGSSGTIAITTTLEKAEATSKPAAEATSKPAAGTTKPTAAAGTTKTPAVDISKAAEAGSTANNTAINTSTVTQMKSDDLDIDSTADATWLNAAAEKSSDEHKMGSAAIFALVMGIVIILVVVAASIKYFHEQYKRKDYDKIEFINKGLD